MWFLSFHISIPKLCTQYISRINYLKNNEQARFLPVSIKYPLILWIPSSSLTNDTPITQSTTRLHASSTETHQYLLRHHLHLILQIIHHQNCIVLFNCCPPPHIPLVNMFSYNAYLNIIFVHISVAKFQFIPRPDSFLSIYQFQNYATNIFL